MHYYKGCVLSHGLFAAFSKRFRALFPVFLTLLFFCGCGKKPEPLTKTDFVLDTVASISVYDKMPRDEGEEVLSSAFSEIRRYEKLFSAEIEGSDIYRINTAGGKETGVSPETAELIDIALYYSSLSDGAFDITIRPVSKLWDFRSGKGTPPDPGDIERALSHVGYGNIELNREKNTVRLKDPDSEIDPGGIAKGYIGDRIREFLINKGISSAIINLGGNVLLIGTGPGNGPFKIGVEKPFSGGEMETVLELSDVSVVTSGNYERFFYYEDRLYHHILDTRTGYPVEKGLNAVSVVSGQSVDADALSTVCFCLGREGSMKLLERLGDKVKNVYFIDNNNKLSTGY